MGVPLHSCLYLTERPLLSQSVSRSLLLQVSCIVLGRNSLLMVVKSGLRFRLLRPALITLPLLPIVDLLWLVSLKVRVTFATLRLSSAL